MDEYVEYAGLDQGYCQGTISGSGRRMSLQELGFRQTALFAVDAAYGFGKHKSSAAFGSKSEPRK